MPVLKTGISPVFSRFPHYPRCVNGVWDPVWEYPVLRPEQRAGNPKLTETGKKPQICWFDEMLGRFSPEHEPGLYIPDNDRPLLLIVSGPAGTAKSTFALQTCFNYARENAPNGDRPAALYMTTETSTRHVLDKVDAFNWKDAAVAFKTMANLLTAGFDGNKSNACYIYSTGAPHRTVEAGRGDNDLDALGCLESFHSHPSARGVVRPDPDILVIDSLNTVPGLGSTAENAQRAVVDRIERLCSVPLPGDAKKPIRPKILIVVLDLDEAQGELTRGLAFFADAIIRFDMRLDDRRLSHRTVEIRKIKLQKHAEGAHAIEILRKPEAGAGHRDGKTPFVREGGVFVYPSIPWYLEHLEAFYPRAVVEAALTAACKVHPEEFGKLISARNTPIEQQLFFLGHTVACVGNHSPLKTRVVYASLLKHVLGDPKASGLIVSLSANRAVVKGMLVGILKTDFKPRLVQRLAQRNAAESPDEIHREAAALIEELFCGDQLSFIHHEPSYLTPGEFFHRVYTAYSRPRLDNRLGPQHLTSNHQVSFVVVDGLDQLESKFPLCAAESLFVPTLITMFKSDKKSCAIFLSNQDSEPDASASASALIPLADMVLRFDDPIELPPLRAQSDPQSDLQFDPRSVEGMQATVKKREGDDTEVADTIAKVTAVKVPFADNGYPDGILWLNPGSNALRFSPRDIPQIADG